MGKRTGKSKLLRQRIKFLETALGMERAKWTPEDVENYKKLIEEKKNG